VVTPLHRRQQIYAVCQKHDIVILEDDPYFYLQFSASSMAPRGLHNLGASYLSLDTDGRVIRLDSFSKVQLATFHHRLPVDRMQAQQKASLSCNHELSLAHRRSVVCWDGKCQFSQHCQACVFCVKLWCGRQAGRQCVHHCLSAHASMTQLTLDAEPCDYQS